MSDIEGEDNNLIKYTPNFGEITQDSKCWDDFRDFGEKQLSKMKIIKIKVFTGIYKERNAILGISFTYRNSVTGDIKEIDHKGSLEFIDVKEFVIAEDEYLTDFHIRLHDGNEYITQIGYSTNKSQFLVPEKSDDGENKYIDSNGGNNIIIGTFGCINEKLDATGVLFIPKEEYLK